jgi:uncharacterized protein
MKVYNSHSDSLLAALAVIVACLVASNVCFATGIRGNYVSLYEVEQYIRNGHKYTNPESQNYALKFCKRIVKDNDPYLSEQEMVSLLVEELSEVSRYVYDKVLQRARDGDATAQFDIAERRSEYGNFREAFMWYHRSASQGYAESQAALGHCYFVGKGVRKNYNIAFDWWHKAAEQRQPTAMYNVGWCYQNGYGCIRDYDESRKWYRKAAAEGNKSAQKKMGKSASVCQKEEEELEENKQWQLQADAQTLYNQGLRYIKGENATQDTVQEGIKLLRKAAKQGSVAAQCNLGLRYSNGYGVPKDYVEAVRWYRLAAEQGEPMAQYNLGDCYKYGNGVRMNMNESVKWFRKAAEQGQVLAQFYLGVYYEDIYSRKSGDEQDMQEALRWFRLAANQGLAEAQFNIGVFYMQGEGLEKNMYKAVEWFRLAANQGHARAEYFLGMCYERGWGVEKNIQEAIKWYDKASLHDDVDADKRLRALGVGGRLPWSKTFEISW